MKTKFWILFLGLYGFVVNSNAQVGKAMPHQMQHGFVLAADDRFASHLVASGHHSRQTEITGQLLIYDRTELATYQKRKAASAGSSYFLFQAQSLDLPSLKDGQVLLGHIVEAKIGTYDPKNIIVKKAALKVGHVLLNIENPFFGNQ